MASSVSLSSPGAHQRWIRDKRLCSSYVTMDSDNSPAHAGLSDPLLAQGDLDLNPSASNPMVDVGMTSDTAPKRQRIKANRNDPNFRGFGCYFSGCDFISTGKNGLSAHLGISHGLKQNERELDKIERINNAN